MWEPKKWSIDNENLKIKTLDEADPTKAYTRAQLQDDETVVNSRVPKTVRHGTSLHRICPKVLIDSSPSWLESIDSSPSRIESQTSVCRPTAKLFGSSPIQLESQASVCQPTLKLFGLSPSRLEFPVSVCWPLLRLLGLSPSRLSFDQRRNFWLTSQLSVTRPLQPITTHLLEVYHPPVTETKISPIVCTAQN